MLLHAPPSPDTARTDRPLACRELTRALLQRDHGIAWDLPPGHLVPPVPNRANYLHWLNDLLGLAAPAGERTAPVSRFGALAGVGFLAQLGEDTRSAMLVRCAALHGGFKHALVRLAADRDDHVVKWSAWLGFIGGCSHALRVNCLLSASLALRGMSSSPRCHCHPGGSNEPGRPDEHW